MKVNSWLFSTGAKRPAKAVLGCVLASAIFAFPAAYGEESNGGVLDSTLLQLEAIQNEANAKPGLRSVPAKLLPAPPTVSKELQKAIASPYSMPKWTANHPRSAEDWKKVVEPAASATRDALPSLREKLAVSVQQSSFGGVNAYIVTPKSIPKENTDRVAIYLHGGGFVYNPGEAGTIEPMYMASYGGYRVISVDYRMPPDHPYPAALDDAVAAYRDIISKYDPRKVAVFGTSAGGNLTLALILRLKAEKLPLPGAIAPGTPWSDLTEEGAGDTAKTLEWVDNTLISYNGYIRHSAPLYANGRDLKDPYLSPIYGDWHGFPPAIVISGTRDLFLSLSVLTHRKLRQAGVPAELHVWEGMSHAQYYAGTDIPESKEVYAEVAGFFNRYLAR